MCTKLFETLNEVLSNPSLLVPPYLDFPLSFVDGFIPCAIKDVLGQNRVMIKIIIACVSTSLDPSWTHATFYNCGPPFLK